MVRKNQPPVLESRRTGIVTAFPSRPAGKNAPRGRLYHAAYGSSDKLKVVDISDTAENFKAFGETLVPDVPRGHAAGTRDFAGQQHRSRLARGIVPNRRLGCVPDWSWR